MLDLTKLSSVRIKQTIKTLEEVKKYKGSFNLAHFSNHKVNNFQQFKEVQEVHPCGNSACVIGYQSLTPEWAEVGGATDQGEPRIKDCNLLIGSRAGFAYLWFTGNEITYDNVHEANHADPTAATILAGALTSLCHDGSWDKLDEEVREYLESVLDIMMPEYGENQEDTDEIMLLSLYGVEDDSEVTIDQAIEKLEWLLTLDITE